MITVQDSEAIPADELKMILRRALNTLEPNKMPPWALKAADTLDRGEQVVIYVKRREPEPQGFNSGDLVAAMMRDGAGS
jgi:hypothetical protein